MKRVYVYRYVDLESVKYFDMVFLYKKEAFNELKTSGRSDYVTDLIFEVVLTHDINVDYFDSLQHNLSVNNLCDDEIEFIETAFVIYKR